MRSIRRLALFVTVVGALMTFAPAVEASIPHNLTFIKDCSQFSGTVPSYCTITDSNVAAIPPGTKVWYYGPVISSSVLTSSNVTIKTAGNTASGYCQVDNRTGDGMCTFWKGTGTLAGFHAIVVVSAASDVSFNWVGRYWITGR
jgi:hypothetical protein